MSDDGKDLLSAISWMRWMTNNSSTNIRVSGEKYAFMGLAPGIYNLRNGFTRLAWGIFCAHWIMVSHAAIIGRE